MTLLSSRRRFLGQAMLSAAALKLLPGCSDAADDADADIRLAVLAGQDPAITPYWIARDRQLFEKQGCSTSILLGGPNSPPLLTLLAAKTVDMVVASWFSVADAVARGNDLVVVGAGFPRNPNCIISRPDRPIRTAADIVGKKLLLQFTSYKDLIDAILAFNHVKGSYSMSPVGYNADVLFAGDGDGYFAFIVNGPIILEAEGRKPGKDFLVTPLSAMGYTLPDSLLVVRRETLERKRDKLDGFFKALLQGYAINAEDVRPGVKLLTERYLPDAGINPANQIRTAQAYLGLSTLPGSTPYQFGPAEIERMYAFAGLAGRTRLPAAGRLFDMSLLAAAARSA